VRIQETDHHVKIRVCRACKGSGLDPRLGYRYTTGGHNARSCAKCDGAGVIEKVDHVIFHGQILPPCESPDCF
jgi:DnaJ-class molecular chaperone